MKPFITLSKTEHQLLNELLKSFPPYYDFDEDWNNFDVTTTSPTIVKLLSANPRAIEEIMLFLDAEGFVTSNKNTYKFTDAGRKLREAGSYEKYIRQQHLKSMFTSPVLTVLLTLTTIAVMIAQCNTSNVSEDLSKRIKTQEGLMEKCMKRIDSLVIEKKIDSNLTYLVVDTVTSSCK